MGGNRRWPNGAPCCGGPCTTTPLAVHVAHRVWVAAGRCGADEQGCVPAMAVTIVADAMMISSTGSTTTARNLAAGLPGPASRRCRVTGAGEQDPPGPAGPARRAAATTVAGAVRGGELLVPGQPGKDLNLEAMRGSDAFSAVSIPLRMRSWQAGKLISLLLSVQSSPSGPGSQGRAEYCVTSRPSQLSLPSQRKTCVDVRKHLALGRSDLVTALSTATAGEV